MSSFFKWAELPPRKDVYAHVGTTTWGNHDLYPIPKKERKFTWFAYFAYTIICGVNITDYSLGSTYIAVGLSAAETIGCILGGSIIAGLISYITARPGLDHGIGFTVWLRSVFGLKGTYFPISFIAIAGVIYAGLQAYYGALAFNLMLGAIIPQFAFMSNTLPDEAAITTQGLIGFLCYFVFYIPMLWLVKPYQMKTLMYPGFFIVIAVMFGLLIWAINGNGGSVGPLMTGNPIRLSSSDKSFRIAQCLFTVIGTWGGASERFSDWSRFARSRHSPTLSFVVGMPLGITFSAAIGCLVTSAYYQSSGTLQWNPLVILTMLQATNYTPGVRAATFFAGLALLYCQMIVNICNNTIGWSMDMCGILPKYLSMKRAAILQIVLILVIQPWRFLSQAYIFVEILSVNAIFLGASCSIMMADYYLIKKRKLIIPELFIGNENSIYWYMNGVNWRAVFSLLFAMWPSVPGLAFSIMGVNNGWTKVFQINYVVGGPTGFLTYLGACYLNTPEGRGIQVDMEEDVSAIEGVGAEGSPENSSDKKGNQAGEKNSNEAKVLEV